MDSNLLTELLSALRWDLIWSILLSGSALFISKWFVEFSAEHIHIWNERRKLRNHPYFREGGPVVDQQGRYWMIKEIRDSVIVLSGDIGLLTVPIADWQSLALVFAWVQPVVRLDKSSRPKCRSRKVKR